MISNHRNLDNAAKLQGQRIFLGSPLNLFDALRSGYWAIHFLNRNCYYGIEPNEAMLSAGLQTILPISCATKNPHFHHNDQFDAGIFNKKFDFFLACSIWSHAAKPQIETMLDQFIAHSIPQLPPGHRWAEYCPARKSRFLTSYLPATGPHDDYQGSAWVGRSHQSDQKGTVRHALPWIRAACQLRGLTVTPLPDTYNFSNQTWLMIERAADS